MKSMKYSPDLVIYVFPHTMHFGIITKEYSTKYISYIITKIK